MFLDLARGLVARGVETELVLVRPGGAFAAEVPDDVEVTVLGRTHTTFAVPRLARHLRRRRPDAVIAAITHMNAAAIVAARAVGLRAVVATHHNHLSVAAPRSRRLRDRWSPLLARATYRHAAQVVAVSEGVARDLVATAHVNPAALTVIYNPIDIERVRRSGREAPRIPWEDERSSYRLVVAAGRLVPQKSFDVLLRAAAHLPHDFRVAILGDGPERGRLVALRDELGLDRRVHFAGFVDNPYPWFAAADVVASSSSWEALPTVLIEALAFRAPIVATDCPSGPAEILGGGRWGRLCPVGEPAALAAAIAGAAEETSPDRDGALDRYDVGRIVEQYLDVARAAAG